MDSDKNRQYQGIKPDLVIASIVLIACIFVSVSHFRTTSAISSLSDMTEAELVIAHEKMVFSPETAHPQYIFALTEELLHLSTKFDSRNTQLLKIALEKDGEDPFAWANYSYLKTRETGHMANEAIEALRTSIELCRVCDRALIKWRLEYVLATWDNVPEDIRLAVFEGADVLRWWHLEYEYLSELRRRAETVNIPFLAYQRRVGTRVRPQEIGLPPGRKTRP